MIIIIKMPGGNTALQYPFPYKNTSGDGGEVNSTSFLVVTNTTPTTGFIDNTGALIVKGGTQLQGDLWVNGNIYVAGRIYQSSFTPVLAATTGTLGNISYTRRTGNYQVSTDSSCIFYTMAMSGTYTAAITATLEFGGLPNVSSTTIGINTNVKYVVDDFTNAEIGAKVNASSLAWQFVNISTSGSPTINGTGTFSFIVSGCYVTSSGGAFTPTLTGTGTLGTLTYNTQNATYGTMGFTTVYHTNMNISTSGTTLTVANVAGFPNVVNSIESCNSAYSPASNIDMPLILRFNPAANTATMYNQSSLLNTTITTTSTMDLKMAGYYMATGFTGTFVPSLGGINVGSIAYSERTCRYEKTALCNVFTINMVGTYTGSNCAALLVTGFPNNNGITECITKQIYSDIGVPITMTIQRNSNVATLNYNSNGDAVHLVGSGSFNLRITGFYLSVS